MINDNRIPTSFKFYMADKVEIVLQNSSANNRAVDENVIACGENILSPDSMTSGLCTSH